MSGRKRTDDVRTLTLAERQLPKCAERLRIDLAGINRCCLRGLIPLGFWVATILANTFAIACWLRESLDLIAETASAQYINYEGSGPNRQKLQQLQQTTTDHPGRPETLSFFSHTAED